MSDWCPENDRAWQAEQAERHGENTLKARIDALMAERDEWKRRHFKMRDERDKAQIDSTNLANFSHEWRQRAEKAEVALQAALRDVRVMLREIYAKDGYMSPELKAIHDRLARATLRQDEGEG